MNQVKQIFQAQQENFKNSKKNDVDKRIHNLKKLKKWILENGPAIREAQFKDFKKPAAEVNLTERLVVLSEIRFALRRIKKWAKPKKVPRKLAAVTASSWIYNEPKGVVLIISPWNYPFNLSAGPLASALAAGNNCIIKPSEYSPNTSELLVNMVKELFAPEEVTVVTGGPEISEALTQLPFDHIYFTGSSRVGKVVMENAAKNLTPVTLELGGKSPAIIDESADLRDAASKLIWGKFLNAGQTCIAPDYIYVHQSKYAQMIELLQSNLSALFPKTAQDAAGENQFCHIISPKHFETQQQMLKQALEYGAKSICKGAMDKSTGYFSPHILAEADTNTDIMQKEIFGPLLPVTPYQSIDEVIEQINSGKKPLSLYVFSHNKKNIRDIIAKTSSGAVGINDVLLHYFQSNLPFGGIGNSGFGKAHGKYGFDLFSNQKAVLKNYKYTTTKLFYPPYSSIKMKLINLAVKYL